MKTAEFIISELQKYLSFKGLKINKLDSPVTRGYSEEWDIQDSDGMYHELLQRLALVLAQTEGWEIEDIHGDNPRMKIYLKMPASCLGEIDNYLEEQEIEFGDLEVNARYEMPQVLNQEEC